jgi:FkbM family methyltransferase
MKFVSYAQNFEDVMLWRALAHVEHGCYVDIGAQDPVVDSVSKAFYERGWRGVHVEPVPAYANALRAARPDETVLQVALAETDGTLELNVIADTGLSTAVEAYAERHEAQHGFASQTMQVPALTMKSALAWLSGRQVHWLKIDVEGLEERVLRGWDSTAIRPWIMVVEATIPNSRQTDFSRWEPILLKARYQFAYFDGLNRFYVAAEHAELMEAFSAPPNVFDEAQLSGLASSELCRKLLSDHAAELVTLTARQQQVIDAQTVRHQQAIDALTAGHDGAQRGGGERAARARAGGRRTQHETAQRTPSSDRSFVCSIRAGFAGGAGGCGYSIACPHRAAG